LTRETARTAWPGTPRFAILMLGKYGMALAHAGGEKRRVGAEGWTRLSIPVSQSALPTVEVEVL